MTPSSPNTAQTTPRQDAELKRQVEIMRRAVAVPVPDDDSDFTPDKARRGAESWRIMASNLIAAFDSAALSPAPEAGEEGVSPPLMKALLDALEPFFETVGPHTDAAYAAYLAAQSSTRSAGGEVEPVAWERRRTVGSNLGWVPVDPEDIPHYRSVGQEIRGLYASPPPARMPTREIVDEAIDDEWRALVSDGPDAFANPAAISHDEFQEAIRGVVSALFHTGETKGGGRG